MKVLMLTAGTRGDVQPYVALAGSLQQAGHEAVVASATPVGTLGADHGVELVQIDQGPGRVTDSVAADQVRTNKLAVAGALKEATKQVRPMLDDAWAVAREGADVVVHNPRVLAGGHVAEKLGVPSVVGAFQPIFAPTRAFPVPMIASQPPEVLNRLTYRLPRAMGVPFRREVDAWREETLGLERTRGRHALLPELLLHAFSEHLVPTPDDWPSSAVTTGFWLLPRPEGWQPPRWLEDFLTEGGTTVYAGFGSMAGDDPRRTAEFVLDAIRRAGVRAVLSAGWGGLVADDLPPGVVMVDDAPHDWLFERVDAVVHHGGAGTTAAAAAAGRPQVVCPFLADQPFWGRQVHAAGVGPAPLPQRDLTRAALASAIESAVHDYRHPATALGHLVRAEDGTGRAVRELERLCRGAELASVGG